MNSLEACFQKAIKLGESYEILTITRAKDNEDWVIVYEPKNSSFSDYYSYINLYSLKYEREFKLNYLNKSESHIHLSDLDIPDEPIDFTNNGYGTILMGHFMKKISNKVNKVTGSLDYKDDKHLDRLHRFYNRFGLTTIKNLNTIDWEK